MNDFQSHLVQQLYPRQHSTETNITKDRVTLEYNDILPSYSKYVECKRNYQLDKESIENVENAFKLLLNEIYEFLDIIYISTENKLERELMMSKIDKFKMKH